MYGNGGEQAIFTIELYINGLSRYGVLVRAERYYGLGFYLTILGNYYNYY